VTSTAARRGAAVNASGNRHVDADEHVCRASARGGSDGRDVGA
jgi:hypothetical protein